MHTCDWRSTVVVGDKRQASVAQRPSLALHGVIDVSNKQGQGAFSRPATHRDVVSASFCAFDEQTLSRLKGDKKHRLDGIVCIYILRAPAGLLHKDIDILRDISMHWLILHATSLYYDTRSSEQGNFPQAEHIAAYVYTITVPELA